MRPIGRWLRIRREVRDNYDADGFRFERLPNAANPMADVYYRDAFGTPIFVAWCRPSFFLNTLIVKACVKITVEGNVRFCTQTGSKLYKVPKPLRDADPSEFLPHPGNRPPPPELWTDEERRRYFEA